MNNYIRYTAEELAQDDSFRQWVRQPDSEMDRFWTDFLRQHPDKQSVVVTAKALLKAVERITVVPTQEQGHRMWMTIEDQIREDLAQAQPLDSKAAGDSYWLPGNMGGCGSRYPATGCRLVVLR